MRDGKPLVGLAFDSIGRYGHGGLLRERFIPAPDRGATPTATRTATAASIRTAAFDVLMTNEKPGGHGERPGRWSG